jgi:uncharacterized repeat protein (TIGR03803 family)
MNQLAQYISRNTLIRSIAALAILGVACMTAPAQTFTTLVNFNGTNGDNPFMSLVQGTDGNLYGTTNSGGANGAGTVFKVTPTGKLTTLYSFCAQTDCTDGSRPLLGLVLATNGTFYGTTTYGGASSACPSGCGTVFSITSGGTLTTLHSFDGADGSKLAAALVQATNGTFYGTAVAGGASGYGTVFSITSGGTLTTLHNFAGYPTDGATPEAPLVQATNGTFYGTTYGGGVNGSGTVFSITSGGTLTTLYSFCFQSGCTDGEYTSGGLVQATSGTLYGTTYEGGASNDGTIFSLTVGLGPFVKTLPTSGKVGAAVTILGTNLTGATSVSFNGTAATFTVVTGTEIRTTVPSSATTGKLQVKTPGATLSSNLSFRVTPVILSFSPPSGPPGTVVTIDGNSLTGATSVTFGGVKATSFTVKSYTQITATVPTGAKTGKIGVTTPGGTVTSTGTFTVN